LFLFCGEVIADFKEALETIYVQNDFENLHSNGEKVHLSTSKVCSCRHEIGEALKGIFFEVASIIKDCDF